MLKQKRFFPILLAAAVMLAVVLFAAVSQSRELTGLVRFQDSAGGRSLDLFYDQEADSYVLFLPPYTDPEDVSVTTSQGISVTFGKDERTLANQPLSENIAMTVFGDLQFRRFRLRLEPVSDLPSIFVDGEEGLLEYLHADKSNTRDVVVTMVDEAGNDLLHRTSTMYGRGNGSWNSPSKKPYNLAFSEGVTVGPFENVTKLCLLAEFSDESKLRNSIGYFAGEALGIPYTSPYQYTNLYVNGEYMGLYGLVTKQEYQNHIQADEIQAVFEIATGANRVEFYSELGWRINVMYGQKETVRQAVSDLESALEDQDWDRVENVIDLNSFARKYALEEFLANLDLAYASQYFYLDKDQVIHCMQPWDYDWTLGSSHAYYNNRQVYELKAHRDQNSWYTRLLDHPKFCLTAADIWEKEFSDAFLEKLNDHVESSIRLIDASWKCDRLRWKYEEAYNQYDLSSGVEDLQGFASLFGTYFQERRELLVDLFRNWEDYGYLYFYDARWGNLYLPKGAELSDYLTGATILDVKVPGERFLGWYGPEGEPASLEGTVTEDLSFRGMYEELEDTPQERSQFLLPGLIVAAFGSMALGVFITEWKKWKR